MYKQPVNVCSRCGKTRILSKSWTEKRDTSTLKYTLSLCPDEACQKLVERDNDEREKKRLSHLKPHLHAGNKSKQLVLK